MLWDRIEGEEEDEMVEEEEGAGRGMCVRGPHDSRNESTPSAKPASPMVTTDLGFAPATASSSIPHCTNSSLILSMPQGGTGTGTGRDAAATKLRPRENIVQK